MAEIFRRQQPDFHRVRLAHGVFRNTHRMSSFPQSDRGLSGDV